MAKISVIIPVYNSSRFIAQTIESVLAQTYTDYEIIVVDDGSTDDIHQCLMPYLDKIKYIYQKNQERSVARNRGVTASSGEYLVFLDGDDLLLPHKLAKQSAILDHYPNVGLVAGGYQYINENNTILREIRAWLYNPSLDLESILFRSLTVIHAVLLRRSWFDKVGGFDPQFSGPEDMDLWYRLSLAGCPMVWERSIVCQYRIHSSNSTINVKKHYDTFFAVLDKLFSRSDIPAHIRARRNELYAQICLTEAGQLYAVGQLKEAQASVRIALDFDPSLQAQDNRRFLNTILNWRQNIRVFDKATFLEEILSHLPSEISLSPANRRYIFVGIAKAEFYAAAHKHDCQSVQNKWFTIARQDPSWLLNRGSWSILLRALGYRLVHNGIK
ncbi:MAG: glycosyltransferase [Chloroflexi bacterium]|nr:glycosyltransferase [Chloroflexota bacterium]